jgi:hypothetical protein
VLYEDNVPRGLLVGRLDVGRLPIKVGYFSLPVAKMRILQFGGWLGDISDSNAKLLVGSIVESLTRGEADVACLQRVDSSSPLVRYAKSLPQWCCTDYLNDSQIHRVRELSCGTGAFLTSLSQNERYQQRKRARKIEQNFRSNKIELFHIPDRIDRLTCDAETIARRSYQRGLGVGFWDTPAIRSRLEFEARRGWLRGYILYLDEKPCAFWIGSLRNQVFLSDYLAFDSAYSKYAPGMYLILKVIEELCNGKIDRVDFGPGDAPYKERLGNADWQESLMYIFAPTIRATGVNAFRLAVGLVNHAAMSILRKTRLLGSAKRLWRTRLTRSK